MDALISSGMVGAKEVVASTPGGQVVKLGLLLEDGPLRDEKEAMVKGKGVVGWKKRGKACSAPGLGFFSFFRKKTELASHRPFPSFFSLSFSTKRKEEIEQSHLSYV